MGIISMKFIAILGAVAAGDIERHIDNQEFLFELMQLQNCPEPLEISEDNLHYQLGEFSRNFEMENWNNAMHVKGQLEVGGARPKFAVTTKELYDKSFSFPKVRN